MMNMLQLFHSLKLVVILLLTVQLGLDDDIGNFKVHFDDIIQKKHNDWIEVLLLFCSPKYLMFPLKNFQLEGDYSCSENDCFLFVFFVPCSKHVVINLMNLRNSIVFKLTMRKRIEEIQENSLAMY
jgi:hypothetical protein